MKWATAHFKSAANAAVLKRVAVGQSEFWAIADNALDFAAACASMAADADEGDPLAEWAEEVRGYAAQLQICASAQCAG